jgi:hypothetical protein
MLAAVVVISLRAIREPCRELWVQTAQAVEEQQTQEVAGARLLEAPAL